MLRKFLTFLFVTFAAILIIAACQLKEPVLPAWETTLRLPFTMGDFVIGEEIVNDSTIIIQSGNADSVLFISLKDTLVDLREISADDLSILPDNAQKRLKLDTLVITTLQSLEAPPVNLRTLFPGLSGSIGLTVTIPDTTISAPPALLDAGDFKRIHFISGDLRLRVLNNLPFPIGPNGSSPGGLKVTVINDSLNQAFVEFSFPNPIPPGSEAVSQATVENKWLYSSLRLEYQLPVAQPTQVTITNALLDTAGVALSLGLDHIRADEAVAVLGPQSFSDVLKLGYEGQHRLRSAEIERGTIGLTFTSHLPLDTDLIVKIPALRSAANDTFTAEINLPAQGIAPLPLLLDGYSISNPDNPGDFLDTLELVLEARTQSQNNIIHLSSEDSISVDAVSDTLVFRSFSGFLGADTLELDPIAENNIADYGGFEGTVQLDTVFLNLKIYSEVQIENLAADLTISGFHENEEGIVTDSAAIILDDQHFNGGNPGQPGVTEFTFNNQETVDFLSILPTSIRIEGKIRVSGNAEVSRGDRIWIDYVFETPFKVRITGVANFEGDVKTISEADIDTLFRDAAENNILDIDLRFELTNHTPLGGTMRFVLSGDPGDPDIYDADYDTSLVIIRDISMEAAPVDPVSGFVTVARESEVLLYLNQREVQLFSRPPLRYGYQLRVPDTGGFVTLRYSDYVRMPGSANLRLLINDK